MQYSARFNYNPGDYKKKFKKIVLKKIKQINKTGGKNEKKCARD